VPLLLLLARSLNGQGRAHEAMGPAWEACRVDPNSVSALVVLSEAASQAGQTAYAVDIAERAVSLAPHGFVSHYTLGRALLRDHRVSDARRQAEETVRLAPSSPDAHNLVGMCFSAQARPREARIALGRALELDPQHAQAMNNLAILDIQTRPVRATRALTRAASVDPHLRTIHQNLRVAGQRLLYWLAWAALAIGVVEVIVSKAEGPRVVRVGLLVVLGVLMVAVASRFVMSLPRGLVRSPRDVVRVIGVSELAAVTVLCFAAGMVVAIGVGDRGTVDDLTPPLLRLAVFSAIVAAVRRVRARRR
jgi:Flp pilus assembly protein TadD